MSRNRLWYYDNYQLRPLHSISRRMNRFFPPALIRSQCFLSHSA
jgi:hypothetical protein